MWTLTTNTVPIFLTPSLLPPYPVPKLTPKHIDPLNATCLSLLSLKIAPPSRISPMDTK